jgi:AraC-like DNA-binding protein
MPSAIGAAPWQKERMAASASPEAFGRDPSVLSSWSLAIARALEARGRAPAAIFARAGLDIAALTDPEARYPLRCTSRLWRLAVEETGDPCFGLEVARHISPTTFHALGFSILSSTTLCDVFERVVRCIRLVSEGSTMSFEDRGDAYRLVVEAAHGVPPEDEAVDALFAVMVRLCRLLTDRHFAPLRVELQRPRPPAPAPFARCFRAPVAFASADNALLLDRRTCERRLPGANPEVARTNDEVVARALGRMDQPRFTDRVRAVVVERLPGGKPPQSEVARAVGSSTRGLQRRLSAEGTTYAELVDGTRRGLAMTYTRDSRRSLTEIAYLLGFSGGNNFTRAFRRWTGKAPSEYRR